MNRLDFNKVILIIFVSTLLFSCTEDKKIPLWEITKPNAPTSYLVGTIDYCDKEETPSLFTDKLKSAFDSSSTYLTQIDIINSDFILTKNHLEIGMNKTLKDILSETDFNKLTDLQTNWDAISKNKTMTPDSVSIKLLFYLQDMLYANNGDNFYFDQYWLKQAMASKKTISGMEPYQKFYQDLASVPLKEQIEFMQSITSINDFQSEFRSKINSLYKNGDYENIYQEHLAKFPYNKSNYLTLWVNKHRDWSDAMDPILNKEKCFICMDVKHLYGKENFLYNLLLKGYKINKIQ